VNSGPPVPREQSKEERRTSEEARQRAEELRVRHATVVESSNDAIVTKTLEGVITDWNLAAQRMFGYSEEEAVGQPITLVIPPELQHEEVEILRRVRAGERIEHYETQRVSKDGKTIDVSITVSPMKDAAGRITGASKIARDITENKRREAALRESEERFRLAMSNVASGVYTLDPNGLVTYVNPAAETMLGWTSAELLGRQMHDATHYKHPDGSPFPASECPGLQVVQNSIERREQEDTFIRKDGSFLPVVYSASPLRTEGRTVGIVVGFRDDTLRRESERAVRESEERFRLLANTAPVLIWIAGVDTMCTYFNQPWLDFTGRSLDEELGHGWAQGVHPHDMERCLDTYKKAFDRREPFQMEYRLRRRDGEYRWMVDTGVPRFDVDASFAGYVGSCVDMTERNLAAEVLSTVNQRLIEAHEEERTRLARELHDDINQRLALLRMHLMSVTHSPTASAAALEEWTEAAIRQVGELSSDVQALSHRLHSSKLDLIGLTAAAAGFCKELADQQGVDVDFHSENIPTALPAAISLCLFRVLQEALLNAVKHSGSRHFRVSLAGRINDVDLTVQDSGIGFDPQAAVRGRGLGLVSMRERLKLVNGQLFIHSELQRGTTLHARVPRGPDMSGVAAGNAESRKTLS
jgi:PAS domain S-box-containing protein